MRRYCISDNYMVLELKDSWGRVGYCRLLAQTLYLYKPQRNFDR